MRQNHAVPALDVQTCDMIMGLNKHGCAWQAQYDFSMRLLRQERICPLAFELHAVNQVNDVSRYPRVDVTPLEQVFDVLGAQRQSLAIWPCLVLVPAQQI